VLESLQFSNKLHNRRVKAILWASEAVPESGMAVQEAKHKEAPAAGQTLTSSKQGESHSNHCKQKVT